MIIKKKDIKPLCEHLSRIAGGFSLFDSEGRALYTPESVQGDAGRRVDIIIEGAVAGYVESGSVNATEIASLIGLYIKNINEKNMMTKHALQK